MVGRTRVVPTWGFPRIRGTVLEIPIIKMAVLGGLDWGPFILGKYRVVITL